MKMKSILLVVLVFTAAASRANPTLKLPFVFSDHMVLQREIPVNVWGHAAPGATVEVAFGSQRKTAVAGPEGKWTLQLEPLSASSLPRELTIRSGDETIAIKDVLVGEVWICSGQSNMEKPIGEQRGQKPTVNAELEIAEANYPGIRLLQIPKSSDPEKINRSRWTVCSPTSVNEVKFSAVGYFFARKIHKDVDVPVGMIHSSWGGTRIEPWTPTEAFDEFEPLKQYGEQARRRGPTTRNANTAPAGLWNAMIQPVVPFTLRGALWYQGESNVFARDRMLYLQKMCALVNGWRTAWDLGDFPFYYVQLAPYIYSTRPRENMNEHELPALWEAQLQALQAIPNSGMVVTTDLVDDVKDIHPVQKREIGERLALWALADTYKRAGVVKSGPLFQSAEFKGGKAILQFSEIGSGLASRDAKPLTHFTIAGEDQKFVKATATIDGEKVIVAAEAVSDPKAVRFAWDELAMPNLVNKEGLPASPFRTDTWELPESPPPTPASQPATQPAR